MKDVADAMGVSEATARRAKLDPDSPAYRTPPSSWREAVIQLAETRIARLRQLIEELRQSS